MVPILAAQSSYSKTPVDDLFGRTPKHLYMTVVPTSANIVFECPLESDKRCEARI